MIGSDNATTALPLALFHRPAFTNASHSFNNTYIEHVESLSNSTIAEIFMMLLIFLVASVGNAVVVLIVTKKRRMQSFVNWLILNLAIADLAVCIICIPLDIPIYLNNYKWLYGKFLCPIFYPLQTATIYGSVFTLVAMSLSRYWAIIHPFRRQPTVRHAKIVICLLWLASFLVVLPYVISLRYDEPTGQCVESFSPKQIRTYTLAIFICQYALPLIIISAAYARVCLELKSKSVGVEMLVPVNRVRRNEARRVVKLLIVVTLTFAVCVLPYHLVFLYNDFIEEDFTNKDTLANWAYILLYMNSALNPVVYNAFNVRFRQALQELLKTIKAFIMGRSASLGPAGFFSPERESLYIDAQAFRLSRSSLFSSRQPSIISLRSSGSRRNSRISLTSEVETALQQKRKASISQHVIRRLSLPNIYQIKTSSSDWLPPEKKFAQREGQNEEEKGFLAIPGSTETFYSLKRHSVGGTGNSPRAARLQKCRSTVRFSNCALWPGLLTNGPDVWEELEDTIL